ncbi:MAG TPA: glycoside hydrolase family 38 C-terminal domain-containing protein [Ktedonobacteraceae bacterium]|nr:glycoside hydrolase family 38 C-terminal domain-containing protein [Ktedonobacteraceae bacterium]
MSRQLTVIIVPHTHWDREWYQTFQQFRIRLVHTIDTLLDILDRDPDFLYFMLDGQTIVLDDYLEVQPEQQERLKRHIQSGRVLIGPWYLQPDEFLVSGEALVRNLQFGLRRAADFGEPMRVGYLPDCFGHIAQMPQILRGFGIDNAVFWRGVSDEARKSEFFWAAPDGTKVLVIHLADTFGYSNARTMPLNPHDFAARVELLAANLLPKATTSTLLFMNGSDHLEPQDGLPATIKGANALLRSIPAADARHEQSLAQVLMEAAQPAHAQHSGAKDYDSIQVQIGTLPQYIEAMRQQNPDGDLQVLQGEMRSSQYSHLLPAVLSTRMWIKQQNTATEHLLERWVEPLTAWAAQLGASYPAGLVRLAWKYLLQNHPHDSICGCSIDQVHAENRVRFAESQQVSESILAQAMQSIVEATDTRAPFAPAHSGHPPVPIVVFNPAPGPRTAVAQAVVQLPGSLHKAALVDEHGTTMPYTVINRWSQERGAMELPRETVQAMLAFLDASEPGALIDMAHSTLNTTLGEDEDANVITHVRVEVDEQKHPGVARIELLIAARGQGVANKAELLALEGQLLELLNREDIHTLHLSVVDQARETVEFVASDLPAYGLKTYWLYPRGLDETVQQGQDNLAQNAGRPQGIAPTEPSGSIDRRGDPLWSPALADSANTIDRRGDPLWSPVLAGTEASNPINNQGQGGRPQGIAPTETSAQADSTNTIENEWYRVEANAADGTLTITDKQTGAVFSGLNRFLDDGDVGDLYTYCPPEQNTLVSAPVEPPRIELVNVGSVRATLRISGRWKLPAAASAERAGRSAKLVTYPITSEVTLIPGLRRIDIQTSVDNAAKDHRLRVAFPVPFRVGQVAAEGTFEVRSRPITAARSADVSAWAEAPVNTFPQKRFVDISNGEIGLGVLNRGLPEYEVLQSGPGMSAEGMAVAVTLLRCVEWLSRGDLATRKGHAGPMEHTPEAQCLGQHVFDYALVPHSGDWQSDGALVLREAQSFNTGVRALTTDQHTGQQPSRAQLLAVEPAGIVVSAIKRSNDGQGLVVRVYNPLPHDVEATLRPALFKQTDAESGASKGADKNTHTPLAFTGAFMANLQEEILSSLPWDGEEQSLHVTIRSGEIKTVLLQ